MIVTPPRVSRSDMSSSRPAPHLRRSRGYPPLPSLFGLFWAVLAHFSVFGPEGWVWGHFESSDSSDALSAYLTGALSWRPNPIDSVLFSRQCVSCRP
jgi:hypothetical protein